MSIPAVSAYSMPAGSELPKNKAQWKADPERSVLLIHDMQKYFLKVYSRGESPMVELLRNVQMLKKQCAELGIPVVYTAQPGDQKPGDRALLQDFWGPGLSSNPSETEIIDELKPDENDIVLTKWRYSAFKKTNLLNILQERGRDQLIISGVYAHIGCLLTACDAFMMDIQPFLVADAIADFSLEHHRMAVTYAAERCAVTTSTRMLLDELKSSKGFQNEKAPDTDFPALTYQLVRKQVADLLDESPSDISDHEDLINRGLDSIRIMSLVENWRRAGAEVNFMVLAEQPTLSSWWKLLSSSLQKE
ncbi:MAG: isochorismatase family protein [Thermoactinomyces sp.]